MQGARIPESRPKPPPPPKVPGGFGLRGRVPDAPKPKGGLGRWSSVISILTTAAAFLLLSMLATLVVRQFPANPSGDVQRALPLGDAPGELPPELPPPPPPVEDLIEDSSGNATAAAEPLPIPELAPEPPPRIEIRPLQPEVAPPAILSAPVEPVLVP